MSFPYVSGVFDYNISIAEKILKKIRKAEAEIAFAPPQKAAKLTSKIVRLKATVFDRES